MYYTYILFSSSKDCFYIGSTSDIFDRYKRHNGGRNLATKAGVPWDLVYFETHKTRSEAIIREKFFKKKKSKVFLVKFCFPYLNAL